LPHVTHPKELILIDHLQLKNFKSHFSLQ